MCSRNDVLYKWCCVTTMAGNLHLFPTLCRFDVDRVELVGLSTLPEGPTVVAAPKLKPQTFWWATQHVNCWATTQSRYKGRKRNISLSLSYQEPLHYRSLCTYTITDWIPCVALCNLSAPLHSVHQCQGTTTTQDCCWVAIIWVVGNFQHRRDMYWAC